MRLVLGALVAVALVAGFTSQPASAAQPSPGATSAAVADRAGCGSQQAKVAKTKKSVTKAKAQLKKATKSLKKAQKRLKKAKRSHQAAKIVKAQKAVKKAKAAKKSKARKVKKAKRAHASARAQLRACQNGGSGDTGAGALQPLCDLGLPQAICDALDALPLPAGNGVGTSPIKPLCDAGLPAAICAAANAPLVGGASPIQPLCDAGLPQGICDIAAGVINPSTLPVPSGLPGLPSFAFPGLPEVPGLDVLLAILSPVTNQVPLGTLCGQLDIPVVCDLVV